MLTNDEAIENFCDEWERLSNVGDIVYGLHLGHERECSITISSLRALVGELRAERTRTETLAAEVRDVLGEADPNIEMFYAVDAAPLFRALKAFDGAASVEETP